MTACPLRMPFCFFNTIKCLHTVWTLETLTTLAETRGAAQAFNSFKWHQLLSWLRTRSLSARRRRPPHGQREGQDWGAASEDQPRAVVPHFRWLQPEEDTPDSGRTVGITDDETPQSRHFWFPHFSLQSPTPAQPHALQGILV